LTVNASYRLGILIFIGTILASAAPAYFIAFGQPVESPRAAQEMGDLGYDLGAFRMIERSGKAVTEADLAGDVWVSAFIFTRCPISCPRISSVMKGLQGPLGKAGVRLVSVSVDPDFDTPEILTRYAQGLEADPARWWFLTGKQDEVVDLILNRFHLDVARNEGGDPSPEAKVELVRHSPRLVLVDRGNKVSGFYDSNDPKELEKLVKTARRLASWARPLPALNASLNGSCAVLLLVGWSLILMKMVRGHAACMIAAVAVSSVFLACYLAYHFEAGSVAYRGLGWSRFAYFTILLSHTTLAALGVVPLVSLTLIRAIRKEFHRHASIARVTFPIWLYVSITGVVIYWMLYQMPVLTMSS
jgi:protein SCO1